MILVEMFQAQQVLKDRIEAEHPVKPHEDRFSKRVLALLVELGECANEQRSWKFWSIDQKLRRAKLLVEYVDGLHFVLELGLEANIDQSFDYQPTKNINVVSQLLYLFDVISFYRNFKSNKNYLKIMKAYLGLGEMLGFSWEEIEQAYFAKNQVNHERQNNGY